MAVDTLDGDLRLRRGAQMLRPQDVPWSARLRMLVIWLVALAVGTVILVAPLPLSGQVTLQVGDVALNDVTAPRAVTYVSDILTQQRKDLAANAVPEVYDPPQARVGRQQLTLASQILSFIASVRSDTKADQATKAEYLAGISGLSLPPAMIDHILTVPEDQWEKIATETQVVLDRVMHDEISEKTLDSERRKVPAQVRLDLPDEDAAVISQIVQDLLVPNSFYNAAKTDERRQAARDQVEPVTTTVERNEIVLRAGTIVTPLDMEALNALGLKQGAWTGQELRSAAGLMTVLILSFLYYLWRQERELFLARFEPVLIPAVMLVFLGFARAMMPAHAVLPYVFPFAGLAMLLGVLVNGRVALVVTGIFVLLVGWLTNGNLELMTYAFAGALVGAIKLRRGERLASFAWAAVFLAYTNMGVVLAFRLAGGKIDLRGLLELTSAGIVNALIAMTLTLLGIYILGAIFGLTTPLQLMELSRPTHPLLRQLLLKAPGTYHHTLIVSNMAERAAEAVGADAQLARVGAYYHDVGKTIRPYFFVENRTEAVDPHSRLDPYTSAQVIISHVKDGVELARKYRLPQRVIDFIPEHQGTLVVSFFYHQAVKQAGGADKVDRSQFTYPGPRPQSRETAITMLADGAEATVRAKHPASIDELSRIISESVQSRVSSGQLDDCALTLHDLQEVQRAFVDVLRGIHHPRVTYPENRPTVEETHGTATAHVDVPATQS